MDTTDAKVSAGESAPAPVVKADSPAPTAPAAEPPASAPVPTPAGDELVDSASSDVEGDGVTAPGSAPPADKGVDDLDHDSALDDSASDDSAADDSAADDSAADDSAADDNESAGTSKKRARSPSSDSVNDSASSAEENDDEYEDDGFVVNDVDTSKSRHKTKRVDQNKRRKVEDAHSDDSAPDSPEDKDDSGSSSDDEPAFNRLSKARREIEGDEDDLALVAEARGETIEVEETKKKKKKKKKTHDDEMDDFIDSDSDSGEDESESDAEDDEEESAHQADANELFADDGMDEETKRDYMMIFGLTDFHKQALEVAQFEPGDSDAEKATRERSVPGDVDSDEGDSADEDVEDEGDEGDEGSGVEAKLAKMAAKSARTAMKHSLKRSLQKLRDQYEPSERSRNYVTEYDDEIRSHDRPERLYIRNMQKSRTNVDWNDMEEVRKEHELEAAWIFSQLKLHDFKAGLVTLPDRRDAEKVIAKFLKLLCVDHNEIPYIWHYLRDEITLYKDVEKGVNFKPVHILGEETLWKIYDLDDKWTHLRSRWHKLAAQGRLFQSKLLAPANPEPQDDDDDDDKMDVDATSLDTTQPITSNEFTRKWHAECVKEENLALIDSHLELLDGVNRENVEFFTEDLLRDMKDFLLLHFPEYQPDNQRRRASKRSEFTKAMKAHLLPVARGVVGMTAFEFAENLETDVRYHKPKPFPQNFEDEEHVKHWGDGGFVSQTDLWQVTTSAFGCELAQEPKVKQYIRKFVEEHAVITVAPTAKGYKVCTETDPGHMCKSVMAFRERKLCDLFAGKDNKMRYQFPEGVSDLREHEAYLLILRGHVEGLLTYDVSVPTHEMVKLFQRFCSLLLSEPLCDTTNQKNAELLQRVFQDVNNETRGELNLLDGQRAASIKCALSKLIPGAIFDLQKKKLKDAQQHVANLCGRALRAKIQAQPLIPPQHPLTKFARMSRRHKVTSYDDYDDDAGDSGSKEGDRLVAVFISSDRRGMSVAVVLNEHGECIDHLQLAGASRREDSVNSMEDIIKLMKVHRPRLVLFNTTDGDGASRVRLNVEKARGDIEDEMYRLAEMGNHQAADQPYYLISHVDDECALLFAASEKSNKLLGEDMHANMKAAIAMGRESIDPLTAYAAIWEDPYYVVTSKRGNRYVTSSEKPGGETMSVKFHEFQDDVPREMLLGRYEREFLIATALVGVDINRAILYPHWGESLRFVSGLGERKAMMLKQVLPTIVRTHSTAGDSRRSTYEDVEDGDVPILRSRSALHRDRGGPLKKKCYNNALGFLRLGTMDPYGPEEDESENGVLDALDLTRIHPNDYMLARVMIAGAREMAGDLKDVQAHEWYRYARRIMLEPDAINGARREFTKELKDHRQVLGQITLKQAAIHHRSGPDSDVLPLHTLEMIQKELLYRSPELRTFPATSALSDKEGKRKFELITGQTKAQFREGTIVPGTVTKIERREGRDGDGSEHYQIGVRLDCGVSGVVHWSGDVPLLKEVVDLVVAEIDYGKCRAKFDSVDSGRAKPLNPLFFDPVTMTWEGQKIVFKRDHGMVEPDEVKAERKIREAKERGGGRKFVRLAIAHDSFHNINGSVAAIAALADLPIGEKLFRPSSNGVNFLTLTWKVTSDIYAHVDIEQKVDPMTKQKTYHVVGWDEDAYEELDELLANYYDPISDFVNEMQSHEKYFDGDIKQVHRALRKRWEENPKRLHYYVMSSSTNPGYFQIHHSKSFSKPITFRVTPRGFRMFGKYFQELNHMLAFFKTNTANGKLARIERDYKVNREKEKKKKLEEAAAKKRAEAEAEAERQRNASSRKTFGEGDGGHGNFHHHYPPQGARNPPNAYPGGDQWAGGGYHNAPQPGWGSHPSGDYRHNNYGGAPAQAPQGHGGGHLQPAHPPTYPQQPALRGWH